MKRVATILIALIAVAFILYRFVMPLLFVWYGRGPISAETVQIEKIVTATSAFNDRHQVVSSSKSSQFVVIDILVKARFTDFDIYDFQLVKNNTAKLGYEENIGDNSTDNYFYWSILDANGKETTSISDGAETKIRLYFEIPNETESGYLFYWGEYFGPLNFNSSKTN